MHGYGREAAECFFALWSLRVKRKKEVGQVISSYKDDSSTGNSMMQQCILVHLL